MKNAVHFLITLLIIAIQSFAISLLFGGVQWLLSLIHVAEPTTWGKILLGTIPLFIFFTAFSMYKTLHTLYHMRKDPVFRSAIEHKVVNNWREYKRIRRINSKPDIIDGNE